MTKLTPFYDLTIYRRSSYFSVDATKSPFRCHRTWSYHGHLLRGSLSPRSWYSYLTSTHLLPSVRNISCVTLDRTPMETDSVCPWFLPLIKTPFSPPSTSSYVCPAQTRKWSVGSFCEVGRPSETLDLHPNSYSKSADNWFLHPLTLQGHCHTLCVSVSVMVVLGFLVGVPFSSLLSGTSDSSSSSFL